MIDSGPARRSGNAGAAGGVYFPAIDGLRAIAVLFVLIYHLRPAYLPGGLLGVDIFFVISGFVVTGSLERFSFPNLPALFGYFYARRVRRVVPALLVMLIATAMLADLFMPWMWRFVPNAAATAIGAALGVSNVVLAVNNDAYVSMTIQYMPFFHTWSLGVEEQFYLIFPFLYAFCGRAGRPLAGIGIVAILTGLSFLLYRWLATASPILAFYLMPARFWELGAGMLLWLGRDAWLPLLSRAPRWLAEAAAASGLALIAWAGIRNGAAASAGTHAVVVAASALLVAAAAGERRLAATYALSWTPVLWTGLISYSLYLWHVPLFVLFKWTVGLDGKPAAAAAFLLAFAAAALSYRFIERPFRRSRAMGARPPRRIIFAAASAAAMTAASLLWLGSGTNPITLSRDPLLARAKGGTHLPCEASEADRGLSGGSVVDWTPSCRRVSEQARLFVLGDSHAIAYNDLSGRYASEVGAPVRLYWKSGCEFPPLSAPTARRVRCREWEKAVLDELARDLRPTDVLFLPSMHLRRFGRIWGTSDIPPPPATPAERAAASIDARALLKSLLSKGVPIVIEAPEPVFRSPPFRCSDWFNRSNPVCAAGFAIARREEIELRAASLETIEALAAELPGLTIFDPFPLLCPGDPCKAYAGGKAIYLDDNHLSPYGTDLLYPAFRRAVAAAAARDAAGTAGRPGSPPNGPAGGDRR